MNTDRFKFRVWNEATGEYIETPCDVLPLITSDGDWCYKDRATKELVYFDDSFACVEQCTGLKDKNGKLIYENDIVEYKIGSLKARAIVKYSLESGGYFKGGTPLGTYQKSMVIIGNIHENPELIGGAE